ncbi:MAG: hypothetical protein MUP74_05555 [Desulfobacterales bacterium]|nr:hypothetical protein [Desulfobacterales bacterium]
MDVDVLDRFLTALATLYAEMDRHYAAAAEAYGFVCRGCEDSCCRTRFFHHTLLEYHYLRRGYARLPADRRCTIRDRALADCRRTTGAGPADSPVSPMCPLNFEGGCALYAHRPMICRLHGVPHRLQPPGQRVVHGPGCEAFYRRTGAPREAVALDRTPLYVPLAKMERGFRAAVGTGRPMTMSLADMILTLED